MKKFSSVALLLFSECILFASDPITIDSMFANQQGLRSVTTLQTMSTGNSNSYSTYPDLVVNNEGRYWTDVKTVSLNQTFLYDFAKKFDGIFSTTGSHKRREYFDIFNGAGHKDSNDLDSIWIGGTYSFDTIGTFKPDLTLQASLMQKERYLDATVNSSFKSYYAKVAFKNYSDPVISNLFVGAIINSAKKIGGYKVENGNSFMFGFDMSVVLSPKISLNLGMEQRYQTETKVDNFKYSNLAAISTMSVGATYSLSPKSSLTVSGSMGGSSQSPDSIMSVSIWQKF